RFWNPGVQRLLPSTSPDSLHLHPIAFSAHFCFVTIEEDDEDALDVNSNPPIDEVTDDLEQLHTSQVLLQLRLPSDDVTHPDCDRFELPPLIPPSIVEVTHCSTSCQQQKDFSQMNEASSTSIDSLSGPPLPPSVRILSEIGQPSKATMDTSNAPAMDFPSISCPFW
ncbi:hypothetical protein Dimus_030646, partial [Dionaea muscipula]